MIKVINHRNIREADLLLKLQIESYKIEAELLGVKNFPPLFKRINDILNSKNMFFGYYLGETIVGAMEIEVINKIVHVHSLVTNVNYFKKGIASSLLDKIFKEYKNYAIEVETGLDNIPAINLYIKKGFIKKKTTMNNAGIMTVRFLK